MVNILTRSIEADVDMSPFYDGDYINVEKANAILREKSEQLPKDIPIMVANANQQIEIQEVHVSSELKNVIEKSDFKLPVKCKIADKKTSMDHRITRCIADILENAFWKARVPQVVELSGTNTPLRPNCIKKYVTNMTAKDELHIRQSLHYDDGVLLHSRITGVEVCYSNNYIFDILTPVTFMKDVIYYNFEYIISYLNIRSANICYSVSWLYNGVNMTDKKRLMPHDTFFTAKQVGFYKLQYYTWPAFYEQIYYKRDNSDNIMAFAEGETYNAPIPPYGSGVQTFTLNSLRYTVTYLHTYQFNEDLYMGLYAIKRCLSEIVTTNELVVPIPIDDSDGIPPPIKDDFFGNISHTMQTLSLMSVAAHVCNRRNYPMNEKNFKKLVDCAESVRYRKQEVNEEIERNRHIKDLLLNANNTNLFLWERLFYIWVILFIFSYLLVMKTRLHIIIVLLVLGILLCLLLYCIPNLLIAETQRKIFFSKRGGFLRAAIVMMYVVLVLGVLNVHDPHRGQHMVYRRYNSAASLFLNQEGFVMWVDDGELHPDDQPVFVRQPRPIQVNGTNGTTVGITPYAFNNGTNLQASTCNLLSGEC
jgi:hypothetical protein